jgi:hypothetical protein
MYISVAKGSAASSDGSIQVNDQIIQVSYQMIQVIREIIQDIYKIMQVSGLKYKILTLCTSHDNSEKQTVK